MLGWFVLGVAAAAYIGYYGSRRRAERPTTLQRDGFIVWTGDAKEDALTILGPEYVFLDYEYTIRGCSLSTWHRDVTSGQRYWNTVHPTYTLIHYKYAGDFLSVSPRSQRDFPYALRAPVDIVGDANTFVLFNADMLHAGMPNTAGDARHAVQYKLVHREDVERLTHLAGIHTVKDARGRPEMLPWFAWLLRGISFHCAFIIHLAGSRFMMRAYDDGFAQWIQRLVPLRFYNNETV